MKLDVFKYHDGKAIAVELDRLEAQKLAISLLQQIVHNNYNGWREEFQPDSNTYSYFTIEVTPEGKI